MALTDLLNKARRRVITQLVLDKGALAVAIGMGGAILLLLAGTDVLDWYWPVLLLVGTMGFGIYQLRKHVPGMYELAQRVDQRLGLADSLSTAVHFLAHPSKGSEQVCELQRSEAERTAAQVNVEQAVPYTRSRFLAPAAGLLLVALGLFAVRYAVIGSLDLKASLIQMAMESFFNTPEERAAAAKLRSEFHPQAVKPSDDKAPLPGVETEVPPESKDGAPMTKDGDDSKSSQATDKNGDPSAKDKSGDRGDDSDKSGDNSDKGDKGDQQGKDKQNDAKDGQQSNSQQQQEQRSMLDKMRDAVSNLLNQMTSDQAKQESKSGKEGAKQEQGKNDKGGAKGGDKGDKSQGDPQADSTKGASKDGESQQSDSPGKKTSEDAASGHGTDEGDKALKEAEALEAMGKVGQLLGMRGEQINGDMMVEVGTTKQQLKTASTMQQSGHAEAGGEVHRDQVPLAYQQFVERYFTEIRKGESQAKKGPGKGMAKQAGPGQSTPAPVVP